MLEPEREREREPELEPEPEPEPEPLDRSRARQNRRAVGRAAAKAAGPRGGGTDDGADANNDAGGLVVVRIKPMGAGGDSGERSAGPSSASLISFVSSSESTSSACSVSLPDIAGCPQTFTYPRQPTRLCSRSSCRIVLRHFWMATT